MEVGVMEVTSEIQNVTNGIGWNRLGQNEKWRLIKL